MIPPGPIAVIAPCGAYNVERFQAGLEIARSEGLDVRPLPGNLKPWRFFAATDTTRRHQLIEALTDPQYVAVWIARGGYGLTRLLDSLPYEKFVPRPVIGFSDVTALFSALDHHSSVPCIHGPVLHSLASTSPAAVDALFSLLRDGVSTDLPGETWVEGKVTGPVVGGNLCMLASTCGTNAQIDTKGRILFLEEVGEYGYRIDRMLQQLRSSGCLDGVIGVAVGEFSSCSLPPDADYSIRDILLDHLVRLNVPILGNLPIGHGTNNFPFVWGQIATLDHGLHWISNV